MRTLFALSVLVWSTLAVAGSDAATLTARSCASADVQTAINAALDGDTVVLPACRRGVAWTRPIRVTKGITIRGAGAGATVLVDDVPKGAPATCDGGEPMLSFDVDAPNRWRLTALTIRGRALDAAICQPGHIAIAGTSKAWRIDHVRILDQQTVGVRISGHTYGVVDHTRFEGTGKQGLIVEHDRWGGKHYGDGSWAEPLHLGTARAVYVEDCVFVDPDPVGAGALDALSGGRFVFRYNTATYLGTHGTESGGRLRGVRSYEIYGNRFDAGALAIYTAINLRGGTGVIYDNTFTGAYDAIINVQNFRDRRPYAPWGQCNGGSLYDQNLPALRGYACLDQVGRSTGLLLSGDPPKPLTWVNQLLEPLYQWGNVKNGRANPTIQSTSRNIRRNRDFFDNIVRPDYTPYPYPHPLTAR